MSELDSIYEEILNYHVNDYIIFEETLKRDYYEVNGILTESNNKNFLQKIWISIKKVFKIIKDKLKELLNRFLSVITRIKANNLIKKYKKYYDKENGEFEYFKYEKGFNKYKMDKDNIFSIIPSKNIDNFKNNDDITKNIEKIKLDLKDISNTIHNELIDDKKSIYPFKDNKELKKEIIDDINKFANYRKIENYIRNSIKDVEKCEKETEKKIDNIKENNEDLNKYKKYLEYLNTFKSYLINSIKIYCKEYLNIYKDYCALYIAGGEYLKSGRGAADKRVYDAAKGGEEEINKMDEINNKSKEKIKQAKDFLNNAKRKYNFKYFNPNETYDNAIKNKDKGALRSLLCGIIGSDPTFATTQFEEALKYIKTESDIIHGEELDLEESYSKQSDEYVLDRSKWNEEYFQMLLLWLRYNFSLNKRLSNIKAVGKEVYKNKPTFGKSIKSRHESYIDMDYIMAVTEAEIYEMEL